MSSSFIIPLLLLLLLPRPIDRSASIISFEIILNEVCMPRRLAKTATATEQATHPPRARPVRMWSYIIG